MPRFCLRRSRSSKIEGPRFATALRAGESGEFDRYEEVPANIAQVIIEGKK